jgi:hypothetical protein
VVEVRIQPGDTDVCLSVDGQVEQAVAGGDRIVVKRGRRCVQFVQPGKIGFYQILRRKLYLGETSAESQNETSGERVFVIIGRTDKIGSSIRISCRVPRADSGYTLLIVSKWGAIRKESALF